MRVYVCNVSGCVCAYEQDGANVETNGLRPSVSLPAFPAPPVSHVGACVIVSEQMLGLSILHRFSFSLRLFLLAPFPPHPSFSLPQHNPVKQVLSSQTCHLRFRLKHNCNPPPRTRPWLLPLPPPRGRRLCPRIALSCRRKKKKTNQHDA